MTAPLLRCLAAAALVLGPGCRADRSNPTAEEEGAPRRVLVVTGEDYEGHLWRETTPVLEALLEQDPRLRVEVLDDLAALGTRDLAPYAALVLHFKNYDPAVPGRAGLDNLVRFVDGGGGLVTVHFACGAFEEFQDEYEALVGRVWFGAPAPEGRAQHDPHGPFRVAIADAAHPATAGLTDFETTDELYTCLTGETPIRVLASAVSVLDGRTYPMAFVVQDARRRVFHCVLGHDAAALATPPVAELYRRGAAWAAGLSPPRPGGRPAK